MANYIYEYYQKINDGSIIAGELIKKTYKLIIKDLEEKKVFFDAKKSNRAIAYIENYCRHHEGIFAPNLIKLELWEKAMISCIFGIVDATGKRQYREVFIQVARKNGKTLLCSAIASYMVFMDGEYGARVYFTAPKLEQANLCYEAFYQMIKKEPELDSRARKRRTDIYVEESNSSAKPLAFSAKKSDGLNVSCGINDEIASWEGDSGLKFYEVLKSSQGSREEPLLISISTAGYINDGIYDELKNRCTAVLKGTSKETRLLSFLYEIDDAEKWNDINEVAKANPNLGVSISVEYMLEEIRIAETSLSKRVEFLTKYCNVKQNSSQAWLDAVDIEKQFTNEELKLEDFRDSYAVVGVDLSQTTDLTACTVLIEKNKKIYTFAKFWMPANRVDDAEARDKVPYKLYHQKGWLDYSGENFVDYEDCRRYISDLVRVYQIYPLKVGYDRYSAQYLIKDLEREGFHTDDVFQGENLTPVINETEGLIKDSSFCFGNNNLLKIHLLNSAIKINNESNRKKLIKIKSNARIDGTASLLDAMCVRQKWYGEIGEQLKNEV